MAKTQSRRNRIDINITEAQRIVDELEKSIKRGKLPACNELTITQTEFIRRNIATFQAWGLPKRGIYRYLVNHGVPLGKYESFAGAWVACAKEKKNGKAEKRSKAT